MKADDIILLKAVGLIIQHLLNPSETQIAIEDWGQHYNRKDPIVDWVISVQKDL